MTDPHQAARLRLPTLSPAVAARLRQALDDGTFGACVSCGDEIEPAELLARPEIALCAPCTSELRDRQQGRRLGVCGGRGGG